MTQNLCFHSLYNNTILMTISKIGIATIIKRFFFHFSEKYTRFCQWKNLELNIEVGVYL